MEGGEAKLNMSWSITERQTEKHRASVYLSSAGHVEWHEAAASGSVYLCGGVFM